MQISLTKKSRNSKTGPIPVSTTSEETCPKSCPFYGSGCYADQGPLRIHWHKVSDGTRGGNFTEFLTQIRSLDKDQLWRHNQAGDLPGQREQINTRDLYRLKKASMDLRGFTYTHKPVTGDTSTARRNRKAIKNANCKDFTINLSANGLKHADKLVRENIAPVTTVLDSNERRPSFRTSDGNKVTVCPAALFDITCESCKLCAIHDRKTIIGFPAHSSKKRLIDKMLMLSDNS